MSNTGSGKTGERNTAAWLSNHGVECKSAGYFAPFDLYTAAGTRIEVKTSPFRPITESRWGWSFNIHRHGRVNNENVDVYVLRLESSELLEKYGFTSAIHMVIPSPLEGPTVVISARSLLAHAGRWSKYVDNAEAILEADKTFKDIGQPQSDANQSVQA